MFQLIVLDLEFIDFLMCTSKTHFLKVSIKNFHSILEIFPSFEKKKNESSIYPPLELGLNLFSKNILREEYNNIIHYAMNYTFRNNQLYPSKIYSL